MNDKKQKKIIRIVCLILALIMIAGVAYTGVSLFMSALL